MLSIWFLKRQCAPCNALFGESYKPSTKQQSRGVHVGAVSASGRVTAARRACAWPGIPLNVALRHGEAGMPGELLHVPQAAPDLGHFARRAGNKSPASRVRRATVHLQGGIEPMEPQAHRGWRQPPTALREEHRLLRSRRVPARGLQGGERALQVGVQRNGAPTGRALAGPVLEVDRLRHLPGRIGHHGPGQRGHFFGAEAGLHRVG